MSRLRQRLLLAMGFCAVTVPACSNDTGSVGADTAAETAGDTGVIADTAADSTTTDTVAVAVDTDSAVQDSAVQDSAVQDSAVQDIGPADTSPDAVADADLPMDVCSNNQPEKTCFTAAQLAYAVDNKWGGGAPAQDAGAADTSGPDYPVPPEGCPATARVFDGCCNPAQAGPLMVGDTCCYVFCAGACCGRPLMVGGFARTATVQTTEGWSMLSTTERDVAAAGHLDVRTRAALAEAWGADAAMEHASIASFQRFGLELLRFGAPSGLCADAARAALDEVDHAERTFGLASMLAGAPRGPGPLDLGTQITLAADLEQAVVLTVAEGCVGETFAAALADAAARVATTATARDTLVVIAGDETRHAELAWRFVRWALDRDPSIAEAAKTAFAQALAALPETQMPAAIDAGAWQGWGRLTPRHQRRVVDATVRDVIAPCVRALLGDAAADALPTTSIAVVARA